MPCGKSCRQWVYMDGGASGDAGNETYGRWKEGYRGLLRRGSSGPCLQPPWPSGLGPVSWGPLDVSHQSVLQDWGEVPRWALLSLLLQGRHHPN